MAATGSARTLMGVCVCKRDIERERAIRFSFVRASIYSFVRLCVRSHLCTAPPQLLCSQRELHCAHRHDGRDGSPAEEGECTMTMTMTMTMTIDDTIDVDDDD